MIEPVVHAAWSNIPLWHTTYVAHTYAQDAKI